MVKFQRANQTISISLLKRNGSTFTLEVLFTVQRPTYDECKRWSNASVNSVFGDGVSVRLPKASYRNQKNGFTVILGFPDNVMPNDDEIEGMFGQGFVAKINQPKRTDTARAIRDGLKSES